MQRFAIARGVAFLNDIQGFPDPSFYPELAAASCRLVVMHAVHGRGRAQRVELSADEVWDRIHIFFADRVQALERGGIARERLILDPGMGFFLSSRPEASLRVLAGLDRLKQAFGLPVLVSVSRKSFLRAVTGRAGAPNSGLRPWRPSSTRPKRASTISARTTRRRWPTGSKSWRRCARRGTISPGSSARGTCHTGFRLGCIFYSG